MSTNTTNKVDLSGIAMLSSFHRDFEPDYNSFACLALLYDDAGVDSLVIGGTTGQGMFLTPEEIRQFTIAAKSNFTGNIVSYVTRPTVEETVRLASQLEEIAHAYLLSLPQNAGNLKPHEATYWLKEVLTKLAKLKKRVILYNLPGMFPEIPHDILAGLQGTAGEELVIKNSSGEYNSNVRFQNAGAKVLCGNDLFLMNGFSEGRFAGNISGACGVMPDALVQFIASVEAGKMSTAEVAFRRIETVCLMLQNMCKHLQVRESTILKWILAKYVLPGFPTTVRAPYTEISPEGADQLNAAFEPLFRK